MKVFIAERMYHNDGYIIIGVFSTREAAQKTCDEDQDKTGSLMGDSHEVECFDLIDV